MNLSERTRRSLVTGLLFVGSIVYVAWLIVALGTRDRLFPGFFRDPNLVVNVIGPSHWPPKLVDPPLEHPERLVAVNDQPVTSRQQLQALLDAARPGEEWRMTFIHPDGPSRTLSLPVFAFSNEDFSHYFWLPYLIGAFILLVGFWAFRVHPDAPVAQHFAIFSLLAAFSTGGLYDMLTTQVFSRLWVTGIIGVGAANLYTALAFTYKPIWLRKTVVWRWLPLALVAPLFIWGQIVLYNANTPWLYVVPWRVAYVVDGLFFLLALALFVYRACLLYTSPSPRDRG
jgi:hypothetical protein